MNVNYELVQVDSLGRAAALASGQVDLVFWTNGDDGRSKGGRQTTDEHAGFVEKQQGQSRFSDEQREVMRSIDGGIDYEKRQNKDLPDGTITTQPYFNNLLIPVALK